jgi:energy-coupling factor transport system ATP-binding protein
MSEPAITIRGLSYHYRGTPGYALTDINLEVGRGEFLVVMGPSEAGKSTLAACINGLIPHFHKGRFHGEVNVYGRNTCEHTVAEMSELVGLVFQDFEAQIFSTNVELEVAFGPENFCLPWDEIASRVEESLAYVRLEAYRDRPPATLSGGQKQKLAVAAVLAMRPRILVMDEPTTDLDPISKLGILEITDRLRRRDDISMILVEHETEEVLRADRVALIKNGKLVRLGPAGEVLRDVDLMESLGVMPLGIPRFFKSMGCQDLPLTPEEGVEAFRDAGWRISEERYNRLIAEDKVLNHPGEEPLIRCIGLEHTYPSGVKALDGVDLDIYPGEMVAIVGQNGSGKTTLAKHFNGLLYPTGGSVSVHGLPTQEQGIFKLGQRVGYVFQNPDHQIFSETVFDEVAFSPRLSGLSEDQIKERVQEALGAVGLSGSEEQDPFSLTKSGRQRVAVASVLASRPEVLILDEPTTGLDYAEQRGLMELVRRLNENGSTVIFITHHMWVVAEYAKKVFVIKDGRLFLQGTPREVFSHESELVEASLRPPHFVQFTNRLGMTMLSPQELAACVENGAR